jgi:hypothetical protein
MHLLHGRRAPVFECRHSVHGFFFELQQFARRMPQNVHVAAEHLELRFDVANSVVKVARRHAGCDELCEFVQQVVGRFQRVQAAS